MGKMAEKNSQTILQERLKKNSFGQLARQILEMMTNSSDSTIVGRNKQNLAWDMSTCMG